MINVENLKPFPKFCYTIGMIPTSYKVSLTYEEQLMWFCDFLQNTVIPTVNNNGQAVQELQNLYIELKNYVDTYFENLNVQEEINKKLDAMVVDGTLQEIITAYLQIAGVLAFNTVQDMKKATNLIAGSFVKTYGFYSLNDNGGAFYKVRQITNDDTVDEKKIIELADNLLIAELVEINTIDIRQLGAKPELNFDNKDIIQYAVNNFNKIKIEGGSYYVSNVVTLKSNVEIIGNNAKIYSDKPFAFNGSNLSNILIKNLELESSVDTSNTKNMSETAPDERGYTTNSALISITNSQNIKIENCKIHGSFSGIFITISDNVIIENCECFECSSKNVCLSRSIYKLINNFIHDIKAPSGDYYPCYLFQSTDNENVNEQQLSIISNNRFENNTIWDAIMMHRYNKIIISNNTIKNVRNGIDLSIVDTVNNLGNMIITNNYIEGTDTNSWGDSSALNHAIYIDGNNSTNKNITIANNIINNFGKFLSPSGGNLISIRNIDNVSIINNVFNITESLNAIKSAIYFKGSINNCNFNGNIVNSNDLTCILLFNVTGNNFNIKNNCLNSSSNIAIDAQNGTTLTNTKIDNVFTTTNQLFMRNGTSLNGVSYSVDISNAIYSKKYRFLKSIDTFNIPANSFIQKFITKADLNFDGIFNMQGFYECIPANNNFPSNCIIRCNYSDSQNIQLQFYNLSNEQITIPTSNFTIRYEY